MIKSLSYILIFLISISVACTDSADINQIDSLLRSDSLTIPGELPGPEKYLSVKVLLSHKVANTYEIEGRVRNTAAGVTYKNVVIEVCFYNSAREIILTRSYRVSKEISPDESVSFYIREKNADSASDFTIKIITAATAGPGSGNI